MSFRNTIGVRLALAFASVIIVFVAAVILSIGRLSAFNAAVNQITGPGLTKLEMANAWSIRLLQTAHHTRNMLILDDKNKIQAEVDAVMEDKLQRKEYRLALTASSNSAAETAALQAVADSRVVYVPFEDEFLRDVSAGQLKEEGGDARTSTPRAAGIFGRSRKISRIPKEPNSGASGRFIGLLSKQQVDADNALTRRRGDLLPARLSNYTGHPQSSPQSDRALPGYAPRQFQSPDRSHFSGRDRPGAGGAQGDAADIVGLLDPGGGLPGTDRGARQGAGRDRVRTRRHRADGQRQLPERAWASVGRREGQKSQSVRGARLP